MNPTINIHQELKLVVQIEPIEKIETCIRIKQETDLNKEFAKKVAQNLFNFMQSFNTVSCLLSVTTAVERQCWQRWHASSACEYAGQVV